MVTRGRPARPGAAKRAAAARKSAAPAKAPVAAKRPAKVVVAKPKTTTNVTQYADKAASAYHKAFARWITQEVGYVPEDAASKRAAFLAGVSIATAARPAFQNSEFLEEWREKSGEAKRGPKTADEKRRSNRQDVSDDEFEDDGSETEEDDDEFDESDEDSDDFEDEDEDSEEDDDESDEDEDGSDDDDFEEEEEEEPEPPKRGRGRPATRKPAATSRKPAAKRPARGKPSSDDEDLF